MYFMVNKSVKYDRVNLFPNFSVLNLINNKIDSLCTNNNVKKIKSINGKEFIFTSKNNKYKVIPYDTIIRKLFNDDFFVRTWSRPTLTPSLKGKYFIKNILEIKFENYKIGINKDYSKWAISNKKNIICVGDLNHSESQKERGGNIVCVENKNLHEIIKNQLFHQNKKFYFIYV